MQHTRLPSGQGEGSSVSWSHDGRYIVRAHNLEVVVSDSNYSFADMAHMRQCDAVRCVRFCLTEGKRDQIAVVGHDGYITLLKLRRSVGKVHLETLKSVYLETDLWTVAWSTNGDFLAAGGKGEKLHLRSAHDLAVLCPPISMEGRIREVDFLTKAGSSVAGDISTSFGMAAGTDNLATIFDTKSFDPIMQVVRSRSVRCLRYHPFLPVLAVGDGGNTIIIVDLIDEKKIAEIVVGGRVNSLDFSPCGAYIAVAADNGHFTVHETRTMKVVQDIPSRGFAMSVAFSKTNGLHLALDGSNCGTSILRLGPFLGLDFIPLDASHGNKKLPDWAFNEAIFRSGCGPSFVQRCMCDGTQESLRHVAFILKHHHEAVYTFDRETGSNCFGTASELRKPSLMKLVMTTLVDGTLEAKNDGDASLLTTYMPSEGLRTLKELIMNHPPEFALDLLNKLKFIKTPFTEARRCLTSDIKKCASSLYTDPWGAPRIPLGISKRSNSNQKSDANEKGEVVLTPAVLPLPGLSSLKFLSMLTTELPPEAFNNDAMGLVLQVMWRSHIKRYFLFDFALFVSFYICWILLADHTSSSTRDSNQEAIDILLYWSVLFFNTLFVLKEIAQSNWGRRREHFRSWWNLVDALSNVFVYAYCTSTRLNQSQTGPVALAVSTTLCLTLKLLAYLRGFSETGWLISVLAQNALDVRGFVIILITILLGFTAAFRLLFGSVEGSCVLALGNEDQGLTESCDVGPFGSLARSFVSTFELAIIGSYDPAILHDDKTTGLAIFTFVLAVTVVLVVSLNALIAVLGDSYSRVQQNLTANRRKERAKLIVEYLSLLTERRLKRIEHNTQYFHALLEADDHGDLLVNKDDWLGGLNALKRDLMEMSETNIQTTHNQIGQLKEDLNTDIANLRSELTTLLHDLATEVKGLSKMQRNGGITINNRNVATALRAVNRIGRNIPRNLGGPFGQSAPALPASREQIYRNDD